MKKKSSGALYAGDGGSDQRALCCFRGVRAAIVVIVWLTRTTQRRSLKPSRNSRIRADYKSKTTGQREMFYSQTTFSQRAEQSSSEKEEVKRGTGARLIRRRRLVPKRAPSLHQADA